MPVYLRMEMYALQVRQDKNGDVLIRQDDGGDGSVIIISQGQIPVLIEWLKGMQETKPCGRIAK